MKLLEASIHQVSTSGLIALALDAEHRIGSHVSGGEVNDEYVEKQRKLLTLIQAELKKRNQAE